MEAYFQFWVILAVGLTGLCMVLKVLLDKILHDWDVPADIAAFWKAAYADKNFLRLERAEDIMMEVERAQNPGMNTRLVENKAQLKQADSSELTTVVSYRA
ncbi:MAG: hypothetical protein A3J74_01685 [Elusimicrobia bacterium RIFCSPHIGHO2_02_FULL_57_9]|nr:MAG: hypothetical protein A3J74_01685 [Elusimicrobia bacterium RIFCSPHIGHO2_02_FULL_57_9]